MQRKELRKQPVAGLQEQKERLGEKENQTGWCQVSSSAVDSVGLPVGSESRPVDAQDDSVFIWEVTIDALIGVPA